MLIRKIKISSRPEYLPLEIEDFYIAPDYSLISGVTKTEYALSNGDYVRYQLDESTLFYESPIDVDDVVRQGYLIYTNRVYVKHETYYGKDVTYIEYGGVVYYLSTKDTLTSVYDWYDPDESPDAPVYPPSAENGGFLMDDYDGIRTVYPLSTDGTLEYVDIPVKVYIESGVVNIGEYIAVVDVSRSFDGMASDADAPVIKCNYLSEYFTEFNDNEIQVKIYERDGWKRVTKFSFVPDDNAVMDIDSVKAVINQGYVTVGVDSFDLYPDDAESINSSVSVEINGTVCQAPEEVSTTYGVPFYDAVEGSFTFIDYNTYKIPIRTRIEEKDSGDRILINLASQFTTLDYGRVVIARSVTPFYTSVEVETVDGESFVMFNGRKYNVIDHLCDSVMISGREYMFIDRFEKDGIEYGVIEMGDEVVPLKIDGDKATRQNNSIQKDEDTGKPIVLSESTYDILSYKGVDINGDIYKVYQYGDSKFITMSKDARYEFEVVSQNSYTSFILQPILHVEDLDIHEARARRIAIASEVAENFRSFTFYLKNNMFNRDEVTWRRVYDEQIETNPNMVPISSDDIMSPNTDEELRPYLVSAPFRDMFTIYKIINYATIPLILSNTDGTNIMHEQLVAGQWYNDIKKKAIGKIIDMEKDVYCPYMSSGERGLRPAKKIEFNLHFRTRDLGTWKVNEDNGSLESKENSNWFVYDSFYKKLIEDDRTWSIHSESFNRASDLLCFLDISDYDVANMSMKLKKSFLRLSFYNSNDPSTNLLLATSTIFFDEKRVFEIQRQLGRGYYWDVINWNSTPQLSVQTELIRNPKDTTNPVHLDNDKRLSSHFEVSDRNTTKTSSEGFYIYMFKEYSENLHPRTIFMSVEFNHAGKGKRIPFYIPRNDDKIYDIIEDMDAIKEGMLLPEYYKTFYFPLNVVYDFNTKKYIYTIPQRYQSGVELTDEDTLMFNLFEVKIKNEDEA